MRVGRHPGCSAQKLRKKNRFIVEHSGVKDQPAEGGDASSSSPARPSWQGRVLVHSLFESLCQCCFEKQWRRKISACRGIRKACAVMNWQTARVFEFKLMQVQQCGGGLFSVFVFVPSICSGAISTGLSGYVSDVSADATQEEGHAESFFRCCLFFLVPHLSPCGA